MVLVPSSGRLGRHEAGTCQVEARAQSAADPTAVYALLIDGASWPAWTPISSFRLERAGDPPPEGVGAIRVFGIGVSKGREQIVELVPGAGLSYVSLSGLPVRDYRADVELMPGGDGTDIRWRSSFIPRLPGTGWLLRWTLTWFVRRCASGLADYAAHPDEA